MFKIEKIKGVISVTEEIEGHKVIVAERKPCPECGMVVTVHPQFEDEFANWQKSNREWYKNLVVRD